MGIRIVVGVLEMVLQKIGTVLKVFEQLIIGGRLEIIQITTLLSSSGIMRRVLLICCHSTLL